jgi:hypothetical protein
MFWRPDNLGYTINPFEAGLYDEQVILQNWSYYNDGDETIAVPADHVGLHVIGFKWSWDSEAALKLLDRKKPFWIDENQ